MSKNKPLLWVMKRIRRRISALALMTVADVGRALFGVAFALGSQEVIDAAVAGDPRAFGRACLLQASIILGILVTLTLVRHLQERLRADLDRDWKKNLLHVLLHGDYAGISEYHSGELLNRLNNDVRILDEGILTIVPNLAYMLTQLIAAAAVLVTKEPWFSLLLLIAGAAVFGLTTLMRRQLKGLNKRVSEAEGKVSGFIQETLEKLLMVQAMDVSDEMERRADDLMGSRYEIQRKRKNVSLFANTSISVMSYGAGFAALVWCSGGLLNGTMSFGSLTAITQLVNQLQAPFVNLSGVIPQYIAMTAAAERLMELEDLKADPEPMDELPHELYQRMDAIEASGLSFSYDRDRILDDASFSLPKGSFAAITGPSGIGKSTLLKLLLGVYRSDQGELYARCGMDKVPINRSTRRLFAYVPQGNLLLSGTLRDNLIIAKPEATEEEIRLAIYVSAMEDYLPQLPKGLDTVLGESGAGLSEGQAQRLAIARAILGGAPVLLLDESTSALDATTEHKVLGRIRALPDRTCIAVTHRPATVELCDWRLEMDSGKIRLVRNEPKNT